MTKTQQSDMPMAILLVGQAEVEIEAPISVLMKRSERFKKNTTLQQHVDAHYDLQHPPRLQQGLRTMSPIAAQTAVLWMQDGFMRRLSSPRHAHFWDPINDIPDAATMLEVARFGLSFRVTGLVDVSIATMW